MIRKIIKDKRGVSELVSTAAMMLVIFLLAGIILQLMAVGTAQLAVTAAAFSAARAATRSDAPYATAVETAEQYGSGFLQDWADRLNVSLVSDDPENIEPGDKITIEVTYTAEPLFSAFPMPVVRGSSTQIMEELP